MKQARTWTPASGVQVIDITPGQDANLRKAADHSALVPCQPPAAPARPPGMAVVLGGLYAGGVALMCACELVLKGGSLRYVLVPAVLLALIFAAILAIRHAAQT